MLLHNKKIKKYLYKIKFHLILIFLTFIQYPLFAADAFFLLDSKTASLSCIDKEVYEICLKGFLKHFPFEFLSSNKKIIAKKILDKKLFSLKKKSNNFAIWIYKAKKKSKKNSLPYFMEVDFLENSLIKMKAFFQEKDRQFLQLKKIFWFDKSLKISQKKLYFVKEDSDSFVHEKYIYNHFGLLVQKVTMTFFVKEKKVILSENIENIWISDPAFRGDF